MIDCSVVSVDATIDELLYILAYEQNFSRLGVFEDGILSLQFGAKIIHESIRQLKLQQESLAFDVATEKPIDEKLSRIDTLEFVIPMEIQTNGSHILLPDSDGVAFNLEKASRGFLLSFYQRGFPIGLVRIIENIKENQLYRLLKEAILIPLESDGSFWFASRIILASINYYLKPKKEYFLIKLLINFMDEEFYELKPAHDWRFL